MSDFTRIESRSLTLHRAVAARLRHPYFLSAWDGLVDAPVEQVAAAIVDPGERGQRLRRASPFAFLLGSAERWRVWRGAVQAERESLTPRSSDKR